ncbi:MAG: chemotaxis protein CheW [Rhodocyclaceae bacterium]|jgi:two-component system chemotaxis sensor kinase CheA|nr:chemotaxis protein CheW [Rhodocyclaceae bacterium]
MAIDMTQFYQVFFDEAAEHLANMEAQLLALDLTAPDGEGINAIFRAAHSIKGSSGTFGFTDMTDVTHVLETMLDKVRKGEARMTAAMVDASLAAGDVLKNLLAAHRGEEEADRAEAVAIRGLLEEICAQLEDPAPGESPAAAPRQPDTLAGVSAGTGGGCLDISFMPDLRVAPTPDQLANLLTELEGVEGVEILPATVAEGPWLLRIASILSADALVGSLEFVAQSGSLQILAAGPEPLDGHAPGLEEPQEADASAEAVHAPEEEVWGLFEPQGFEEPGVGAVAEPVEEAYGFFDNLVVEVLPESPALPAELRPALFEEAPDGSFGFFMPLDLNPAEKGGALALAASAAPFSPPAAPIVLAEARKGAERGGPKPPVKAAGGDNSIRVSVDKVDQMINLVGELVITQAMLQQAASNVDPAIFERLLQGLSQLERNTRDLQESVMSIRMLPISMVFTRFPRVVRDLSQKLGKRVELKTLGEDTELDKGLIERITDPLTHLVRNSLDHGIEMPQVRRAAGKPETGTITLKAYHQSGSIVIEVMDDGAGLNRDKILAKARERGLAASEAMSDNEVWQLIFEPGFSTADQVTEVSGRGVGMDVVKKNITAMGGRVEIESVCGVGTSMTVRLPLTLAILDGMSIAVGDETYVIPINYIIESLQPEPGQIRTLAGSERVIQVRGEYLPVVPVYQLFGCEHAVADVTRSIMIVVEADGLRAALMVDALLGQHQVVIKSLEANFRRVAGISGATIMGDGKVALIIDVAGLVAMARSYRSAA